MKPGWQRVVEAIRSHPGATHGDLDELTGLEAITQRISDARKHGFDIQCERRKDSVGRTLKRYYLKEEPRQLTMDDVA